jgi:hypothetical protein
MDAYRQPSAPHEIYRSHRERETATQFRNHDNGEIYERGIERLRRALDNYENNRSERSSPRTKDTETKNEEKDLNERLETEDWHKLDFDEMTQWLKEKGRSLSDAERSEFTELMMSKLMSEARDFKELDSQVLETETELLVNLGEMKSTNEKLEALEKPIAEHGTELESHGQNQNDLQKSETHINDYADVESETTQNDNSEAIIATVEIETPLQSADQITSEITSQFQDQGYEKISSEFQEIGRIEHEFESLEPHPDANSSVSPEIVQPIGTELQPKKVNAETKSEVGDGELG